MSINAIPVRAIARGEVNRIDIDWGENTAGVETGVLKNGDTVSSCTVAVSTKPSGAADPTFGSVTVNSTALYVNGRSCSAGEATTVSITAASDQAYGLYRLKFTATTTNGYTVPRFASVRVDP